MVSTDSIFSIGKYRVVGTLGRGAMGVVYKAQDPEIGRIVAVKVLRAVGTGSDEQVQTALAQFKDEARSAGNLRHPRIITVFEVSSEGASPYIVMDYIDGQGLDQMLARQGALRPELALQILSQIAEGLDHAHERGVIHRDIKPSNILVDSSGSAFIVDFGVASIGRSTIDPGSPVVGSPGYMSPEQILSKRVDRSSDLFSFAILSFEVLSGIRPFDGDNFNAVVSQILNNQPRSMSGLRPEFPLEVEVVFDKALSKKPAGRFSCARDLVDALSTALGGARGDIDSGRTRKRLPSHWKPLAVDGTMKTVPEANMVGIIRADDAPLPETGNDRGWERPTHAPRHGHVNSHIWETEQRPGEVFKGKDVSSPRLEVNPLWNRLIMLMLAMIFMFSGMVTLWIYKSKPKTIVQVIPVPAPDSGIPGRLPLPEALPADQYDIPPKGTPLQNLTDRQLLGVLSDGTFPIDELLKALILAVQKKPPGHLEAIVHLLQNDSYVVRGEALRALANSKEKRFVPAVLTMLEDSDPLVRIGAANALRGFGDRKVVSYLQARLAMEELPEVRGAMRKAIEQLNGFPMKD